jgi:hypothetical protein
MSCHVIIHMRFLILPFCTPLLLLIFYTQPLALPITTYAPLTAFLFLTLLSLTAAARSSSTVTVLSQSMHASVIDTPFLSPAGPSAGTFWLPSWMLDSIMSATMAVSPSRSWSATTLATLGWLR